jgi:hypothetical protein
MCIFYKEPFEVNGTKVDNGHFNVLLSKPTFYGENKSRSWQADFSLSHVFSIQIMKMEHHHFP